MRDVVVLRARVVVLRVPVRVVLRAEGFELDAAFLPAAAQVFTAEGEHCQLVPTFFALSLPLEIPLRTAATLQRQRVATCLIVSQLLVAPAEEVLFVRVVGLLVRDVFLLLTAILLSL